jgi:hypothetical protein
MPAIAAARAVIAVRMPVPLVRNEVTLVTGHAPLFLYRCNPNLIPQTRCKYNSRRGPGA